MDVRYMIHKGGSWCLRSRRSLGYNVTQNLS